MSLLFSTTDCQYQIIMVIKIILAVIVYFIRHLFTQQSPMLFTLMYYRCYPFTHTSLVFSFSLTVSTISAGCARWTLHLPASLAATCVVVVQLLHCVRFFVTPWTTACQAPLSFTVSWSLLELMSMELMMPSNHHPLLSSSPPGLNLSWHQGLYQWVSSLHEVAKV